MKKKTLLGILAYAFFGLFLTILSRFHVIPKDEELKNEYDKLRPKEKILYYVVSLSFAPVITLTIAIYKFVINVVNCFKTEEEK